MGRHVVADHDVYMYGYMDAWMETDQTIKQRQICLLWVYQLTVLTISRSPTMHAARALRQLMIYDTSDVLQFHNHHFVLKKSLDDNRLAFESTNCTVFIYASIHVP